MPAGFHKPGEGPDRPSRDREDANGEERERRDKGDDREARAPRDAYPEREPRDAPEDRGAPRGFEPPAPRRVEDRPPRRDSGDRPPRRDFNDRPPRRNFDDHSSSRNFEERPPRRDYDRRPPRRDYDDRSPRRDYDDRPPRRNFDDRGPRRDYDDRPPRRDYDDRAPRRDYDDRPTRGEYRDDRSRRDYDERAPRRGYDERRDDRPPQRRDRFDDQGSSGIGRGYGNRHPGARSNEDRQDGRRSFGPPPPRERPDYRERTDARESYSREQYSPRDRFRPSPQRRDDRGFEDDRGFRDSRDFRSRRDPAVPPRRDRREGPRPGTAPGGKEKRRFQPPPPPKFGEVDLNEPIRLNKYIARSTQHSRREADELVKRGRVTVNGEIVGPGRMIGPEDVVLLDEKPVERRDHLVYILINKPKDVVSDTEPSGDEENAARTLADVLRFDGADQLHPIHALRDDMLGLQLVTNDPQLDEHFERNPPLETFTLRLTAPGTAELLVKLLPEEGSAEAKEKRRIHAAEYLDEEMGKLSIVVRGAFPAEALAEAGVEFDKVDRLHFAGLTKKDLPRGHWRFLGEREVTWVSMFQQ